MEEKIIEKGEAFNVSFKKREKENRRGKLYPSGKDLYFVEIRDDLSSPNMRKEVDASYGIPA